MRRFFGKLLNLMSDFRTANTARQAPRRASLQVECLEAREVMTASTATLTGSILQVTAAPGSITFLRGAPIEHVREITFVADKAQPSKLDVLDDGTLLGQFPSASINTVDVSVAGHDSVDVDNSNGEPFAAHTNVTLSGSGVNSLDLTGSRSILGETYAPGNGPQAGSVAGDGIAIQFTSAIGSVTDSVKNTGSLVVETNGSNITLSGQGGGTQTVTGLANGGAGDSLTFSNKAFFALDTYGVNADVSVNATAAAAGEQGLDVALFGNNEFLHINATPSTVGTNAVAIGAQASVFMTANSAPVFINGGPSTQVLMGQFVRNAGLTTAGIKANVSVANVGLLTVDDNGNRTTQEHVNVTESTIVGVGLFGNNAATLSYNNVASLVIDAGQLADTYSVVGSHLPNVLYCDNITINDYSRVGLSVQVSVNSASGLDLNLANMFVAQPASASLLIAAFEGTFSQPTPPLPTGNELVAFASGADSDVSYQGFTSVSLEDAGAKG
jgi:hypothetical protein